MRVRSLLFIFTILNAYFYHASQTYVNKMHCNIICMVSSLYVEDLIFFDTSFVKNRSIEYNTTRTFKC